MWCLLVEYLKTQLGPSQTSMKDLSCKNSSLFLAVNYCTKKLHSKLKEETPVLSLLRNKK